MLTKHLIELVLRRLAGRLSFEDVMTDGEVVRLIFEGIVAAGVLLGLLASLLRLGAIGNQIQDHGMKITKIETAIEIVAEQKVELRAVTRSLNDAIARTDETFKRVFQQLDRINERWQGNRLDPPP